MRLAPGSPMQRDLTEPMPTHSQRDFARLDTKGVKKKSAVRVKKSTSRTAAAPLVPTKVKKKRAVWVRLLKWGTISALLLAVLAVVGYWALVFYFEHRLPAVFETPDYVARTNQVTRIYSSNGDVLSEIGTERRTVVPEDEIPKLVKLAVLAAEDADFYSHDGLDYFGMARAMYKNVRDQRFSQGASTITQQVAKTFFLTAEKTIARKLKEVVLARKLEHELSKDQILYLYLNQIYWGHGRYGVREAARHYFGKELDALTLADVALMAGLIAAPERYSPFKDQRKAAQRRAFVLDQMARQEFITPERADQAKREPIRLNFRGDPHVGLGGYASDMVKRFLLDQFGSERVARGGLRVYTSIDSRLQQEAERSLRTGLVKVDRKYQLKKPIERIAPRGITAYVAKLRKNLPGRGVRSGEIVLGVVTSVDAENKTYLVDLGLGPCRLPFDGVSRYAGHLPAGRLYKKGDVLRVSPQLALTDPWAKGDTTPVVNLDQGPQGALVSIDPRTRYIRALVGGYEHSTHPFNRAANAVRQAGSTIKPVMFAAALESGIIEPLSLIRNVPEAYKMTRGKYWKPRNFNGRYDGKEYTARMALAKSINVIAVKILEKTKVRRAIDFAHRVGIKAEIEPNLSIALGSTAVSPLEITNSYATFASGGFVQEAVLVTRVEDWDGTVLYEAPGERRRATTAKVAYRITEMMEATITHGTAKNVRHLGRPAAGKTGTTDHGIDTWFVGYTPNLVTGVWVGFDDRRPVHKATGGSLAAPIWGRYMTAAHEGTPVADFEPPSGLEPLPTPRLEALARATVHKPAPSEPDDDAPEPDGGDMDLLYD